MPQARVFSPASVALALLSDAILEVLADALPRFNTDINGDDRIASSPIAPTDLVINWRRVKLLSLRCTQTSPFRHKSKTGAGEWFTPPGKTHYLIPLLAALFITVEILLLLCLSLALG